MAATKEYLYVDYDDVFTHTMCLFQKYDGSSMSSGSSSSRSSKSSKGSVGNGNGYISPRRSNRTNQLDSDLDIESSTNNAKDTDTWSGSSGGRSNRTSETQDSSLDSTQYDNKNVTYCELCGLPNHERQNTRSKSRFVSATLCSNCSKYTFGKRYESVSPSYQRGSWKRRLRAERRTDIDLTPLLDVLERIDRIDTSMRIPLNAYKKHTSLNSDGSGVCITEIKAEKTVDGSERKSKPDNFNSSEGVKTIPVQSGKTNSSDTFDKDINLNDINGKLINDNEIIIDCEGNKLIPSGVSREEYVLSKRPKDEMPGDRSSPCFKQRGFDHNASMDNNQTNAYPYVAESITNKCSTNFNVENDTRMHQRNDEITIRRSDENAESVLSESDVEFENLFKDAEHYTEQFDNHSTIKTNINETGQTKRRRESKSINNSQPANRSMHLPNTHTTKFSEKVINSSMSVDSIRPSIVSIESSTTMSTDEQSPDTTHKLYTRYRANSKRRLSKGQLELRLRTESKHQKEHKSYKNEGNKEISSTDMNFKRVFSFGRDLSNNTNSDTTEGPTQPSGDVIIESNARMGSRVSSSVEEPDRHKKRRSLYGEKRSLRNNLEVVDCGTVRKDDLTFDITNQTTNNNVSIIIETIPDSYEEFNDDLERQSSIGDHKRSSIRSVHSKSDRNSTEIDTHINIPIPSDNRRGSVSKMKAFWEQRLTPGSRNMSENSDSDEEHRRAKKQTVQSSDSLTDKKKIIVTDVKMGDIRTAYDLNNEIATAKKSVVKKDVVSSPRSDEDESFNQIRSKVKNMNRKRSINTRRKSSLTDKDVLREFANAKRGLISEVRSKSDANQGVPIPAILIGKKKTVENKAIKMGTASAESATDEDEKFRRIQSKLMSRQSVRRKSILKNKNVTSSFLNEFLTVPATRTRNSDSESGSSSAQNTNQVQSARRRVSFQQSVVSLSNSSSSSSYDDSDDGRKVNESKALDVIVDRNVETHSNHLEENDTLSDNRQTHSSNEKGGIGEVNHDTDLREQLVVNSVEENAENEHLAWRKVGDGDIKKAKVGGIDVVEHSRATLGSRNTRRDNQGRSAGADYKNINVSADGNDNHISDTRQSRYSLKTSQIHAKALKDTFSNVESCKESQSIRSIKEVYIKDDVVDKFVKNQTGDINIPVQRRIPAQKQAEQKPVKSKHANETMRSETFDDVVNATVKPTNAVELVRNRRPRAKLFSIAGQDEPDETTKLLNVPVVLDASDSSDVELSWRTRGYNADFYMSRKSTTGSELIHKFREVIRRKRSKDNSKKKTENVNYS